MVQRHIRVRSHPFISTPNPVLMQSGQFDGERDTKGPPDFNNTGGKATEEADDDDEGDDDESSQKRRDSSSSKVPPKVKSENNSSSIVPIRPGPPSANDISTGVDVSGGCMRFHLQQMLNGAPASDTVGLPIQPARLPERKHVLAVAPHLRRAALVRGPARRAHQQHGKATAAWPRRRPTRPPVSTLVPQQRRREPDVPVPDRRRPAIIVLGLRNAVPAAAPPAQPEHRRALPRGLVHGEHHERPALVVSLTVALRPPARLSGRRWRGIALSDVPALITRWCPWVLPARAPASP